MSLDDPGVDARVANVQEPPAGDGTFDVVFVASTLAPA
jgi:hypothetical protein